MTHVRVICANRHEVDRPTVADAVIELDGLITVAGVTIATDLITGHAIAVPPTRPYGDRRAVMAWTTPVASAIAAAVLAALDGSVSVTEAA